MGCEGVSEFDNVILAVGFISCPSQIALLMLFSSTARTTERNIGWLMAKPDGITGVPYDDCRIFTFIPIFPYDIALHSNSTSRRDRRSPERLKRVVMQGGLEDGRRDYAYIFGSLETEIRGMHL